MNSDFKLGLTVLLVAVGLLCAAIVASKAIDAYKECQYIKNGYTHKMLPGKCSPQWVKEPSCGTCGADNKEDK